MQKKTYCFLTKSFLHLFRQILNLKWLTSLPNITLKRDIRKGEPVVRIEFPYNNQLAEIVRQKTTAKWSASLGCWYIPESSFNLGSFFTALREVAYIDYRELQKQAPKVKKQPGKNEKLRVSIPFGYLERLEQERYSANTIKTYTHYFRDFISAFAEKELQHITKEEINAFILRLIHEKNISSSQQNQRINAIKFYYEKVLDRNTEYYQIDRPRKEKKLPNVLSKEEIGKMIKSTENLKHKCLISVIYSCGLRRSEAVNLRIEEIDSSRMLIKIIGAKGKKDRYVPLSAVLLELLRNYYRKEKPAKWLFEGIGGRQYSATSIYNVVKNTARKAGLKKRIYPHILRHSFATHHLEQGTDLRFIQEFLGHESSKTTEIYTHVSNKELLKFKNPFDDIFDPG
jgi:integrase/recombinase XerD